MRKYIFLVILLGFFNSCKSQKILYDFVRLEISYGSGYSIRLFGEGMICKTVDENYNATVKFYKMDELNKDKLYELQKVLYEDNLIDFETIVEDVNVRVTGFKLYFVIIDKELNINKILWVSGRNSTLEKIIKLTNEIIPKEDRQLFGFNTKYW